MPRTYLQSLYRPHALYQRKSAGHWVMFTLSAYQPISLSAYQPISLSAYQAFHYVVAGFFETFPQ